MPKTKQGPGRPPKGAVPTADQLRKRLARYERTIARQKRDIDFANGRLGSTLANLSEAIKDRDALAARYDEALDELSEQRIQSRIGRAQVDALEQHIHALAQRYVGVKLDTQLFTFAQAQDWLNNERSAIFGTLERIDHEQRQPQNMAASSREAA